MQAAAVLIGVLMIAVDIMYMPPWYDLIGRPSNHFCFTLRLLLEYISQRARASERERVHWLSWLYFIQVHSVSLNSIQNHSVSFNISQYHHSIFSSIHHSTAFSITQYQSVSSFNFIQYHSISLNIMRYHPISSNIMKTWFWFFLLIWYDWLMRRQRMNFPLLVRLLRAASTLVVIYGDLLPIEARTIMCSCVYLHDSSTRSYIIILLSVLLVRCMYLYVFVCGIVYIRQHLFVFYPDNFSNICFEALGVELFSHTVCPYRAKK